jgi:hypothetical protein
MVTPHAYILCTSLSDRKKRGETGGKPCRDRVVNRKPKTTGTHRSWSTCGQICRQKKKIKKRYIPVVEEVGTDARTSVREHARGFNVQLIKADHTFRKLFDFFF